MSQEMNMLMSTVDPHLPKWYKGYDIDSLISKMKNKEVLTETEWNVIGEVQNIYYKKYFDKNRKKIERTKAIEQQHRVLQSINVSLPKREEWGGIVRMVDCKTKYLSRLLFWYILKILNILEP